MLHLHGKSGRGGPTTQTAGVTHLRPNGNAPGWGGLEWRYFPESGYATVREIARLSIETAACDRVLVHGFSNGASAAAKLYCRGEDFDGKVSGYVIDDPVVDHAVENCKPRAGLKVRVYWSGALAIAKDGWDCAAGDWTCEGGSTIGIEKYAAWLGTAVQRSPHTTHAEYTSPPEYSTWW